MLIVLLSTLSALLAVSVATAARTAEAYGAQHALEMQISHSDERKDYDGDIPAASAHCMPNPQP